MITNSLTKSSFDFRPLSNGRYKVTYTTPLRHTTYTAIVEDTMLIDDTKNTPEPTLRALQRLRRFVIANSYII